MPECCGVSQLAHVTKFGLSRDPGFLAFFQLEFTSMLSRPFFSPLSAQRCPRSAAGSPPPPPLETEVKPASAIFAKWRAAHCFARTASAAPANHASFGWLVCGASCRSRSRRRRNAVEKGVRGKSRRQRRVPTSPRTPVSPNCAEHPSTGETRSFASAAASVGATSDSDVSAPANVDGSSSAEADATEPPPVAWLARRDGECAAATGR